MMNLHTFKSEVFARALVYMVGSDLSMSEAKAKAAKAIASEYRIKHAREKKKRPDVNSITMPAPVPNDAGVAAELVHAKDRLFNKLSVYFSAFDRHAAEDRKRERAAKQSAERVWLKNKHTEVTQPEPLPADNVIPYPLPYTGAERSAQHIDESMYLPRWRDITMANNRDSIRRNEELQRRKQEGTKQ